jgi:spore maturation protein CgeB
MFNYGRNVLEADITPEIVDFLMREVGQDKWNYYFASQEDIVIQSVIARKVTVEERKTMIQKMADNFDFKLYSVSSTRKYPQVKNMGPVDFRKTAPLIFNQSKVNLYVTPRAITTGIPLRVLEIISCQGFVLTNYQEDLAAEFVEGKEIVMYHSLEDLIEKTKYYLEHEDERRAIIRAGYEKVMREYNFGIKLSEIFTKDSCGGFLI